jgi:anti-anti-sigma regulatory factor
VAIKAGRLTLKITNQQTDNTLEITLEGRIAGPWVTELRQVWTDLAPQLRDRILILDLRSVTYADAAGKRILREIVARSNAKLVTSTPWTQYLAEEITQPTGTNKEAGYGNHA